MNDYFTKHREGIINDFSIIKARREERMAYLLIGLFGVVIFALAYVGPAFR